MGLNPSVLLAFWFYIFLRINIKEKIYYERKDMLQLSNWIKFSVLQIFIFYSAYLLKVYK